MIPLPPELREALAELKSGMANRDAILERQADALERIADALETYPHPDRRVPGQPSNPSD